MASSLFDIRKSETLSLIKKIIKDKDTREKTTLYVSTVINYFFVIFQLYGGIRYNSVWFTALGVYYAVITSVNLYIGLSHEKQGRKAWKVFRTSGLVLTLANLALVMMISVMIATPAVAIHNYSPIMAIGVTIWTFYLLISAIRGVAKQRRKNNAIALAENSTKLIGAIVSVLMLQTAMIASYSTQVVGGARKTMERIGGIANVPAKVEKATNEIIQTFVVSNRVTGVLVIMAVLAITAYMVVKGNREYKKNCKKLS